MNEHVVETGTLFNGDKEALFKKEGAAKKFLDPIDLYDHFPLPAFGSDKTKLFNEDHFFKALHFARFRLAQALQLHKQKGNFQKVAYWYKLSIFIRNRIISANLGLVYGCMKCTSMNLDTDTMLSNGSAALLRSAEKYDPWRANKFSTYACRAILHRFSSLAKKRDWTGLDISDLEPPEEETTDSETELRKDRVIAAIKGAELTPREKDVVMLRFYEGERLIDVGNRYKLSKERIRQIQIKALNKIQRVLEVDPALNT